MTTTTTPHELGQCENCGKFGWHSTEKCPERTTPHPAVVALPPGAVWAEDWQPDGTGRFSRSLEGEERVIPTEARFSTAFSVYAAGYQRDDGSIEDGFGVPLVFISEVRDDGAKLDGTPMSADAARKLADLLVTAADEAVSMAQQDQAVTR